MADNKDQTVVAAAVPEIYADKVQTLTVRGNVARLALVSERPENGTGSPTPVLVGHLAMSMPGFLQLYTQMRNVVRQMEARGLVKGLGEAQPAAAPAKPAAKGAAKGSGRGAGKPKKT